MKKECVFLSKEPFDFNEQKRKGDKGELDFYKEFSPMTSWLDGVHGDVCLCNTIPVEIKSDERSGQTGNFFIEKYSSKRDKKLGGPYKAVEDECTLFVQYNILEREFYFFNPENLANFTEENYRKLAVHGDIGVDVPNKGYTTWGHAIPIKYLTPLCLGIWKIGSGDVQQKTKFIHDVLTNLAIQKGILTE